ncbi:MAG TPA: type I glyceraldehyde-3-phosphate dehydrogenase [Geobacteraceae bacterium]
MPLRVAINGFGRIGRAFFRRAWRTRALEIAAINDLADPATAAHLLRFDSVAGTSRWKVGHDDAALVVGGRRIPYYSFRHPGELPWRAEKIDLVMEATGVFTERAQASRHLEAGAGRVVITAPSADPDLTVVLGVNHGELDSTHHRILSNASCTTNCLAPVLKVIDDTLGIERGLFTTVHSYTNGQPLLDTPRTDLRRARGGAMTMLPTTTGATRALYRVLPGLAGKIDGMSIRVPTPNVSLIDLAVTVSRSTTTEEVNAIFKKAARGELRRILSHSEVPLVSSDYNGDDHSAVVDATLTTVTGGNLVRVVAWYDNEAAFSRRLVELARLVGGR